VGEPSAVAADPGGGGPEPPAGGVPALPSRQLQAGLTDSVATLCQPALARDVAMQAGEALWRQLLATDAAREGFEAWQLFHFGSEEEERELVGGKDLVTELVLTALYNQDFLVGK